MTPRILLPALCAVLAAAPLPAVAQASGSPGADPGRRAALSAAIPEIDRLMSDFAARSRVPGFAYGIVMDGRLVHVRTAGIRELSSRAPVDTGTVFRIASMTKSFTAVAILQLR
ncbi:MAG TPA: serine hydrolase domain-containing protein, partial [Longimicrobium sp.]|nr:serine hydrolase domain-containing protein [Longimicrobium sp.]